MKGLFKKRNILCLLFIVVIIILGIFVFVGYNSVFQEDTFDVNTISLKMNIPLNGESNFDLKITSNIPEQNFKVYFERLDRIASLSDSEFVLGEGESKTVKISFKDLNGIVDVYIGRLVIETPKLTKKIPVVLGVEDENPLFAITQKPVLGYRDVYPGGKVGVDIKIFDLMSVGLRNIKVNYVIKNLDGEIFISEDESFAIDNAVSLIKVVDIPEKMEPGDYVFITSVNYDGRKIMASYFFEINEEKQTIFFESADYYILLVLVFVVAILGFIFYFFKTRSELLRLNLQQRKEMKENKVLLDKYKEELKNDLKKELIKTEAEILKRNIERETELKLKELELERKEELAKKRSLWVKIFTKIFRGMKSEVREAGKEQERLLRKKQKFEEEQASLIGRVLRLFGQKTREVGKEQASFIKRFLRLLGRKTMEAGKEQEKLIKRRQKFEEEQASLIGKILRLLGRKTKEASEEQAKLLRKKQKFEEEQASLIGKALRFVGMKTKEFSAEQERLRKEKKKLDKKTQEKIDREIREKSKKIISRFKLRFKQFEKIREKIIKQIKEKHKRQRKEIEKLKEQGKKKEIDKKLETWEKESGEMQEVKKNLSIQDKKIKQMLKKEKKKVEKQFMKKFYSDLGKKKIKLE